MRATQNFLLSGIFFNNKNKYNNFSNFKLFINKNSFVLKTIYFRFKNTFALQMIHK